MFDTMPAMTDQRAEIASGILPQQALIALHEAGAITCARAFDANQVQPASLDLRLSDRAYRIRASFLPGPGQSVADRLTSLTMHEIDLSRGAVLETGCVYLVPLQESLALPGEISGMANPKSSTGRIDVFTRLITDQAEAFDKIPAGYSGPLYAEISPRTFSVLVREGSRLNQMRLRRGAPRLDDSTLKRLHEAERLVDAAAQFDEGLVLRVDLSPAQEGKPVGWRAKRHAGVIDVDKKAACDPLDFWDPVILRKASEIILDPDEFYILASKEAVHVPPTYAAEMVPFDPLVGEFRVHYAGFFDPGFGNAGVGGTGSRAVLEVRSHEVPFVIEDGQIVGRLIYERLTEPPTRLYGQDLGSNYQAQGLKLSKHFSAVEE